MAQNRWNRICRQLDFTLRCEAIQTPSKVHRDEREIHFALAIGGKEVNLHISRTMLRTKRVQCLSIPS